MTILASAALRRVFGESPALRLRPLIFSLVASSFLLTACGGSASESPYPLEPSSKKEAPSDTTSVSPAEGEPKTVR